MGIIGYALTLAMWIGQQQPHLTCEPSNCLDGAYKGLCMCWLGNMKFETIYDSNHQPEKRLPSSGNVTNILQPLIGQPCTMEGAITIQQLDDGTLLQCVPRWELPEHDKQPALKFVPASWILGGMENVLTYYCPGPHKQVLLTSADGQQNVCMNMEAK